ncbi:MAG TPA: WD40 repeat domain-containing protein, partial [Anaerolineae bacterium]
TGQQLLSWPSGHGKAITGLRFSPDGKKVASGSADGSVRIWSLLPRGELLSIPVGDSYGRIQYSADGTRIVGAIDGKGKVWDASTGQELLSLDCSSCPIKKAIMSPDGKRVITIGGDKNARVWDAANGQQLLTLSGHSDLLETVAYSPDGKWIATGSDDLTTRIWDAKTGENLRTLTGLPDPVTALAFSPDGRSFVTADSNSGIFFDRASGEPVLTLCACKLSPANMEAITYGLSYSPDGKRIGTGSQGGVAELWDATNGAPLLALRGHHDTVLDIAFSRDGKRVVTGSKDGTARIWDATTGAELLSLAAGPNGGVAGVEFNADGTRLLTNGEGSIDIYALLIPDLLQLASNRVTRALNPEECQTYLHVSTCPSSPQVQH